MLKKNTVSSLEIAQFLGLQMYGQNIEIVKPSTMNNPIPNSIVFAMKYDESFVDKVNEMCDIFVIACPEYDGLLKCSYVTCVHTRLYFIRAVSRYFYETNEPLIHPTAIIRNPLGLGENISVGANCVIDKNVTIGDGTVISNNVTITGAVSIGSDCWIKSGAVIGEEGFGFEYNEFGEPEHFPHVGRIEIGDRVFIGSNSTIERAALDVTRLCDDVKVDDLVQIGHNCIVGKNSLIMCGTVLCGGTIVGEGCWIAPNSSIRQRFHIGDNSLVGLGSVVVGNVPPNVIVAGNPAKELKKRI